MFSGGDAATFREENSCLRRRWAAHLRPVSPRPFSRSSTAFSMGSRPSLTDAARTSAAADTAWTSSGDSGPASPLRRRGG